MHVVVPNGATIQEWAAYINEADAPGRVTATLRERSQAVTFDLQERLDAGEELAVRVKFIPSVGDGVLAAPPVAPPLTTVEAIPEDTAVLTANPYSVAYSRVYSLANTFAYRHRTWRRSRTAR
jgi:hypothetical protein